MYNTLLASGSKKTSTMPINKAGISPDYANEGTYLGYWKFELVSKKLTICSRGRKLLELPKLQDKSPYSVFSLLPKDQLRHLIYEFKLACYKGYDFEKELRIITPKGKEKWIRISGMPYHRRWGHPGQMIGVIEDVTQKVKEENMVLAIVNHELRAPLTIIKLNTQMLIKLFTENQNDRPARLLNSLDFNIDGMTRLVEEYLSSSNNHNRDRQLNLSAFDINNLIETVMADMKTVYPGYRFIQINSHQVLVQADKLKIIQVIINYVTNAVNFSAANSQITIKVTSHQHSVEVAVQDQGVGIPHGEEHFLFDRYYQCDRKISRMKNSKGLGLYLVKLIIAQHGGTVRAERGRDCGSTFYFSLPYLKDNPISSLIKHDAILRKYQL
jgi:two-component system sensor histidine kinase VicK